MSMPGARAWLSGAPHGEVAFGTLCMLQRAGTTGAQISVPYSWNYLEQSWENLSLGDSFILGKPRHACGLSCGCVTCPLGQNPKQQAKGEQKQEVLGWDTGGRLWAWTEVLSSSSN